MAVAVVGMRPINMVAWVFLARLLEPRDFGLVALAMLVLSTTNLFSGLGMSPALIHTKLDKNRVAFPAFIVTTAFSSLLFLAVFFNSTFFARLLGDPEVTPVVRALSVLILLNAMALIPAALLKKELLFGVVSKSILTSELVNTGLAVSLAYLGYGLWSLVYGKLAGSLVRVLILWFACPGWDWLIPRRWKWEELKKLLGFGIQNTGSGFLYYFYSNWDDWFVGRVMGSTALGFYSKAYNFITKTIMGMYSQAIGSVLFPSYAKIQDEKARLSRFYIKGLSVVTLAMAPLAMGIFIIAVELVPVLLGEKWIPMVPTLRVFAFMALIRPLSSSTSPLFKAVGRPSLDVYAGLVVIGVMVPLVFLLFGWGIAGVALAVTIAHVVGFGFNIFQINRLLPGTGPKMILAVLPAVFASGMMMLSVQLSKAPLLRLAGGQYDLLSLGAMVVIGAIVYVVTAFLVQRELILETISLMMSALKSRNRVAFSGH